MPRGDKSSYSSKQKRQAEHIEESYEKRGVGSKEAAARAWATVNKETGGAKGKKKASSTKKKSSGTKKKSPAKKSSTSKTRSKSSSSKAKTTKKSTGRKTAAKKK